jgi:hypothetical protein
LFRERQAWQSTPVARAFQAILAQMIIVRREEFRTLTGMPPDIGWYWTNGIA